MKHLDKVRISPIGMFMESAIVLVLFLGTSWMFMLPPDAMNAHTASTLSLVLILVSWLGLNGYTYWTMRRKRKQGGVR